MSLRLVGWYCACRPARGSQYHVHMGWLLRLLNVHSRCRVMMGHSGANLVPVIASNRCTGVPQCSSHERRVTMHRQSADVCHCDHRCGKESFPERAEKTASSIKFHGGSFITGYTGEIIQQVKCSWFNFQHDQQLRR
jgi:hypothetical protein